jgi:CheY-like chemotaxis protein
MKLADSNKVQLRKIQNAYSIRLLSQNKTLNGYFSEYVQSLHPENQLEVFDVAKECAEKISQITVVELKSWNRMKSEDQKTWLAQMQRRDSYLIFLTDPKDSAEVLKLSLENINLRMYFMHYPVYLDQLAHVLESKPLLRKEIKPVDQVVTKTTTVSEKLRVLVAEDNLTNQVVIVNMLKQLGFDYELAKDGREALEKFNSQKSKFNLILMDCQMPEMDGYEATREIRQLESQMQHQKKTPIIALTANAFRETKEE